MSKIRKWK
jgi:hypothetical protein